MRHAPIWLRLELMVLLGSAATALADTSAVDRPFAMSPSVKESCALLPCPELTQVLAQLNKEPRDEPWATNIEAGIRDHVAKTPGLSIRTLECRSFLSAAEVVSTVGFYSEYFGYGSSLDKALWPGVGEFGDERGADGSPMTVYLYTYMRRAGDVYSGKYFYDDGRATFTPNGSKECWMVKSRLPEAEISPRAGAPRWGTADVTVRGVVSSPGPYNNLGGCTHVLEVVEILEIINRHAA